MALPQKVVDQMGRESPETPGWAVGALLFSGGIFFLALVIYFGILYGYAPYLEKQLTDARAQVDALNTKISPSDQTQLVNFYSQVSNLQSILANHVISTQFFAWLEKNTEANVYYQTATRAAGGHVSLAAIAKTEADVNQQLAIFENSPEVSSVSITGVGSTAIPGQGFQFNISLVMNPSIFKLSTSGQ